MCQFHFWDTVCIAWWPIVASITTVILTTYVVLYCYRSDKSVAQLFQAICGIATLQLTFNIFLVIVIDTKCIFPNAKFAFQQPLKFKPVSCLIPRPDEIRKVQSILTLPHGNTYRIHPGLYFLVSGPHGSGKMTLMQQAISNGSSSRALYVSVGQKKLDTDLYSALKIDLYCNSYWSLFRKAVGIQLPACSDDSEIRFEFALEILKQAAAEIYSTNNYPPAIVFDNLARVLRHPDGLEKIYLLQDMAKDVSDERYLIVVFSSSENSVPDILRSRSAKSRLFPEDVYIGDITDQAAVDYLTCLCPDIPKQHIIATARLVGGRFMDLLTACKILTSESDLKKVIFKGIKESLKLMPNETIPVLFDIMRSILQSPNNAITLDMYYSLVSTLDNTKKEVIKNSNMVLIYNGRVECHSRLVKRYFEMLFNETRSLLTSPL